MIYAKVGRETEQWNKFHRYWTQQEEWYKNQDKIEEFIGCSMIGNLIMDNTELSMDDPPEHLKSQFSKRRKQDCYTAKKNSKINKQWIEFAKEHNLDSYNKIDFLLEVGLLFTKVKQIHPNMFGDYYVAWSGDDIPQEARHHYLEVVDEPTFLRLLADFKEQNEVA